MITRPEFFTEISAGLKKIIVLLPLLILSVFLISCFHKKNNPEINCDTVFTIACGRDMYSGSASETAIHGSTGVWEALTRLDEKLEPQGWLAEDWVMDTSGKRWIFSIRDNVRFHSGKLLTADDIVRNIERKIKNPRYDSMGFLKDISSVKKINERSVQFNLKVPLPHFPSIISYYGSPIFNPEGFSEDGSIVRIDGTGPFIAGEINPGVSVSVDMNENYWGKKPFFKHVKFQNIPDSSMRINSLIRGETFCIADIGGILPYQAELLNNEKSVVLKTKLLASTHYIFFNCLKGAFADRNNRLWLIGKINWSETVNAVTGGVCNPAETLFSPLAERWHFKKYNPALPQAVNTFNSSGKVIILINRSTINRFPYLPIAEIISDSIIRSGLKTEITVLEAGAYAEAVKRGEFNILIQPRTLMTGDPDTFFNNFLRDKHLLFPGSGNFIQKIKSARSEMNFSKRKKLYASLVKEVWNEAPVYPLYHDLTYFAHRVEIDSITMNYTFKPDLQGAGLKIK